MDDVRRAEVAQLLAAKRRELQEQISGIEHDVTQSTSGGIGFGKRVGEGTSVAVDRLSQVAEHDGLRETLSQLVRAEESLQEGTYGVCDVCGQAIPAARLAARPFATRCVSCAG